MTKLLLFFRRFFSLFESHFLKDSIIFAAKSQEIIYFENLTESDVGIFRKKIQTAEIEISKKN